MMIWKKKNLCKKGIELKKYKKKNQRKVEIKKKKDVF